MNTRSGTTGEKQETLFSVRFWGGFLRRLASGRVNRPLEDGVKNLSE
jgi:hypothetical protein